MILITTPGFRRFDVLNRQTASQSRANGDGHNCVPNKDRADFPPVLKSDHTIAVVQGALRPMSGVPRISGCGLVGASRRHLRSPKNPDSPAAFLEPPGATRNRRLIVRGASSVVTFSCHVCCVRAVADPNKPAA